MRINRYLASTGRGSRRSCEELVREGRVEINGKTVTDLATDVGPNDRVTVDGRQVRTERPVVIVLNKPKGTICSRVDLEDRRTVFDLLPSELPRLFYVGRLDMDSEGLLVMTNQGELAERLSHPRNKLPKVYHVLLDREFDVAYIPRLKKGVHTEFGHGRMESIRPMAHGRVEVVLTQGLKRQIRLMFLSCGYRVKELRRVQIGGLTLGDLRPGHWRYLDEKEIDDLLSEDGGHVVARKAPLRKRVGGLRRRDARTGERAARRSPAKPGARPVGARGPKKPAGPARRTGVQGGPSRPSFRRGGKSSRPRKSS